MTMYSKNILNFILLRCKMRLNYINILNIGYKDINIY